MECFREFIQKSPRNVFILSTTYPIEFLIISNQKYSENLNMLRFNRKPWVIGNCFYLWINFGIQTSPFSWSESDVLLDFQPCQGGSIQRKYPEQLSWASILSKYPEQVSGASIRSKYPEQVSKASIRSKYLEQVSGASVRSKCPEIRSK